MAAAETTPNSVGDKRRAKRTYTIGVIDLDANSDRTDHLEAAKILAFNPGPALTSLTPSYVQCKHIIINDGNQPEVDFSNIKTKWRYIPEPIAFLFLST